MQRVLAARGVGSRRQAEELIRQGRVSVDGQPVTELGLKVDPRASEIRIDGKAVRAQMPRYVLLNKPRGYITTTSDERDRRTVMELIPVRERIYPVGRLDRDTEGLLLLTNDGDVANRVMHPRYGLAKEYQVLTLSRPTDRTLQRVRDGVVIDGRRVVPDEFRILRETRDGLILKIVVHEGINRVVRRMMDMVGIPVTRLRRVRIGPLNLTGIPVGGWREMTAGECTTLFQALRLERDPEQGSVSPRAVRRRRGKKTGNAGDARPARTPRDRKPSRPDETKDRRSGQRDAAPSDRPRRDRGDPAGSSGQDRAEPRQHQKQTPDGRRRRRGEPPAPVRPAKRSQNQQGTRDDRDRPPAGRRHGGRPPSDDRRRDRDRDRGHGRDRTDRPIDDRRRDKRNRDRNQPDESVRQPESPPGRGD